MAPNLRQLTLLSDSLADISALVHKVPTTATAPDGDDTSSASYWDWPAEVPELESSKVGFFSSQHMEDNLIQDAASTMEEEYEPATLVQAHPHDEYWAEASSDVVNTQAPIMALHTQVHVDDADAYWAESSHKSTSALDAYWIMTGASQPRPASTYWDEANYACSNSDLYWTDSDRRRDGNAECYWTEHSHRPNASDRYWAMAVL